MRTFALRVIALLMMSDLASAGSFTPLGNVYAYGVSADGQVVVGESDTVSGIEAFRWTGGVLTGLGDLPGGVFYSSANGLSADGGVVAGSSSSVNGSVYEAFRWTGGVLTGLGYLPAAATQAYPASYAYGVSADGAVVVGGSTSASGDQAFRWTGGAMTGLGFLPGGSGRASSVANGVSANGQVVVGESSGVSGIEAFRWTGGVMTGLGDLSGGNFYSSARGVSANGSVVVGVSTSASGDRAFRWTGGVMTGLGVLPGGSGGSIAYGVSADGAVVVGESATATGLEAFIWTQSTGIERLFDVLVANGETGLTDWTLLSANAISADGQWIVGSGTNDLGQNEAFLANIAPALPDADSDGIPDASDNCMLVVNANQLDTDGDGYGNLCDGDLNTSGTVTTADFGLLRSVLGQPSSFSPTAAAADMNGSGTVTTADFGLLRARLGTAPGPSGLACAGTVPCP